MIDASELPAIFVLGLARSGTNLLARMLGRHPQIQIALDPLMPLFRALRNDVTAAKVPASNRKTFRPESPFQDHYFNIDGPTLLRALLEADAEISVHPEDLFRLRLDIIERASLESPALGREMRRLEGVNYGQLLASALTIAGESSSKPMWVGIKEVWLYDFVPLLARIFPRARFLAIERDPRAIVGSLVAMAERDPTQGAHTPSYMRHWRKSVALSRRFEADPSLNHRFLSIRYEELVKSPEFHARRLCDELDVEYTPAMLELSADGWIGNSSFAHSGINVYGDTTQRWRDVLSPVVIRTIEYLCGPEMMLTPYPVSEPPRFDADMLGYVQSANAKAGSWRSDSEDLLFDIGGELCRHALLGMGEQVEAGLIHRCFLFPETYAAIQQATDKGKRWQ